MKRFFLPLAILMMTCCICKAQFVDENEYIGGNCTSIMVGKKASADGSVITSHTCDGRYRTWVKVEPAADHKSGEMHKVYKGTAHTSFPEDTAGLKLAGEIPQVAHTYAYVNTAYPCLNEKQLAIGETTFSGPDTLVNPKGMFNIEELERVVLMRCDNARDAIRLIGDLIAKYGYGDGGECITIADKNEVWQVEILGEGPDKIGGIWAAQRVPDDHVAVSANIPRIGTLQRNDKENFMCSDNIEEVAKKYGLWDGKEPFVFWKAFNAAYANGKNFREREFFIFNELAPSMQFSQDMAELPFSIKPDEKVSVSKVMALFRSTYEGTDMDMTANLKIVKTKKNEDGTSTNDTIISPVANPWIMTNAMRTYNYIAEGTVDFKRTIAVSWCSYSFITQLRSWLPDAIGGVCWFSVDNPAESPRIPIFCGNTELPNTFNYCGQKQYNETSILWSYRKANRLATVAWGSTKNLINKNVLEQEQTILKDLPDLEQEVSLLASKNKSKQIAKVLNDYTASSVEQSQKKWKLLEEKLWQFFGSGF